MVDAHYWLSVYLLIGLAFAMLNIKVAPRTDVWTRLRMAFNQTWLWPGYLVAFLLH